MPSRTVVNAFILGGLTNSPVLSAAVTSEVRTLTIAIAIASSLAQSIGTLVVYGNLNGGTTSLTGGTVALLGNSPTVTDPSTFYALEMNLNSGMVALSNATSISN